MADSRHLVIRNAAAAAIRLGGLFAQADVLTNGRRPMPQTVKARIFVRLDTSAPRRAAIAGGPSDWTTQLLVEIVARDTPGLEAETAVDQILQQIHARLLTSGNLGGLALDTQITQLAWDEDELETNVASCTASVQVLHRTSESSLI